MPRPLRPIDDGLIYHVIDRGNNRQDVLHKDADFQAFLKVLADLKERQPFELYGYCHFHLLLRPRAAPISRTEWQRGMGLAVSKKLDLELTIRLPGRPRKAPLASK